MRAALFALLLFLAPQACAETIAFDAFLAGAEKCDHGAAFENFHKDIVARYDNDFGSKGERIDRKVVVRIPPDIASGVGPARPSNKGDHTQVIVPLAGTWRGLALREIEFAIGNENGIASWSFRFAAPRAAVERVFGADVAAAAKRFKLKKTEDVIETSVEILKGKAEIVCDHSN